LIFRSLHKEHIECGMAEGQAWLVKDSRKPMEREVEKHMLHTCLLDIGARCMYQGGEYILTTGMIFETTETIEIRV
jgi:hypothetical protein